MGDRRSFFKLGGPKSLGKTAEELLHIPALPFHIMVVSALMVMFIVLASLQTPEGPLGIPLTSAPTKMPTKVPTAAPT